MSPRSIILSAGEPSGDLHGAAVARALKARWPDVRLYGLGGPRMAEAGVELLAEVERLALIGFVEVARHIPFLYGLLNRLRRELRSDPPDLVIPIDYPGFNLRFAREAKRAGVPVLYYIAPQVWAWHASRVRQIARYTDRMAVVLPFEEALFRKAGANAAFVGHPLLDEVSEPDAREVFCRGLGVDPGRPILALFPGSRSQELKRHLELFAAAARESERLNPGVQAVIACSAGVDASEYVGAPYPCTPDGRSLLAHATAALVKSGTGTLEAALACVPMVIAYRLHPLTYWLARRLVRVEHVGLANLVAGRRLVPEFLQDEATPRSLAAALAPLLAEDDPERRTMVCGLAQVRSALTPKDHGMGAAERVARMAAELVEQRG